MVRWIIYMAATFSASLIYCQVDSNSVFKIKLQIQDRDFKAIQGKLPSDHQLGIVDASLNNKTVKIVKLETRGKTSSTFRRKSYSVQLDQPFDFFQENSTSRLQRFYLVSMAMDKHYFQNTLSFLLLHELGLFDLYWQYALLTINNHCEGLYLLIERPYDYALRTSQASMIIRRKHTGAIEKIKTKKEVSDTLIKEGKNAFKKIARLCRSLHGMELYNALNQILDLRAYFDWLAFNYWIRNGDYIDEVFYYTSPGPQSIYFKIIPWDYDDIFAKNPYEGMEIRNRLLGEKLIFSSADILDRTIAKDPVLYRKYCERLNHLVHFVITKDLLTRAPNRIQNALFPYYNQSCTIQMSKHDETETDLPSMQKRLHEMQTFLLERAGRIQLDLKRQFPDIN